MNLLPSFLLFLTLFKPSRAMRTGTQVFRPDRISYDALIQADPAAQTALYDALTHTGLISITGIPNSEARDFTLQALHGCALRSPSTVEQVFADGTHRRTMATHMVPAEKQSLRQSGFHNPESGCAAFNEASHTFRETISKVTIAFTQAMDRVMSLPGPVGGSLLTTDDGKEYETITQVVDNGEHLEHFHSYQKFKEEPQGEENLQSHEEETIEWHIDQGLFLVFTPGRMIHDPQDDASMPQVTQGFYIQTRDGSVAELDLNAQDDLVFMLGDGVNQYLNQRLSAVSRTKVELRAVPHSLHLPAWNDVSQARVWYGRMVLPPAAALHPVHGMTSERLRETMIDASREHSSHKAGTSSLDLGCSGHMVARELAETTCEAGTIYCWHRCMNLTQFEVSEEICASRGLQVQCINPRGQIWDLTHGDFYPDCADNETAPIASPYPTLPQAPREESVCSSEDFSVSFAKSSDYQHAVSLEGNATFSWNVTENMIEGRIAYDGLFGWLAIGFAGPGGRNGMYGAKIIMALPGSNYSAAEGLTVSNEGDSATVAEYMVDMTKAAFRHWSIPLGNEGDTVTVAKAKSANADPFYTVESNECYTALNFRLTSIHDVTFNITGTDDLVWAANDQDYFVGYHGLARGRFQVDWTTGVATGAASSIHASQGDDTTDDSTASKQTSGVKAIYFDSWNPTIALANGSLIVVMLVTGFSIF